MDNHDVFSFSVDLQKVIMIPRLPGVKSVVFTERIIAYNLTFAPLGDKKKTPEKQMKPYAVTWHEAEGKRSAQEIESGYKFSIAYHHDFNFIFWTDNCSAQNKNWYLFTLLTSLVNAQDMPTRNSITFKYFEEGIPSCLLTVITIQ